MAIDLNNLANGMTNNNCGTNNQPILVQTVQQPGELVACGVPTVPGTQLNMASLNAGNNDVYEGSFTNLTGVTRDLVYSDTIGEAGDYQLFGDALATSPSAVDFALFVQTSPASAFPANAGDWRGFNKLNTSMAMLICKVEVSSSNPLQRNLAIRVGNIGGPDLQTCSTRIAAPICNSCFNGGTDTTFTSTWNGAFSGSNGSFIRIPIAPTPEIAPIPTTVRLTVCAKETNKMLTQTDCCGF